MDLQRSGAVTGYDLINRVVFEDKHSELGTLRTTTQYPGHVFQRVVTNPRGQTTTYGLQAFDSPDEAAVLAVWAPESAVVSIARDVFGKPLSITRAGNGLSATRSYVYDPYQRLCKTLEPETAATVQDYDIAGNLAWRASGVQAPSTSVCDHAAAPNVRKAFFTYDQRNRLVNTLYGDGSPAIARSYTPDGKLAQTRSHVWTWTYTYNNRRLLSSETYGLNGSSFTSAHRHDAYGHLARIDYWGGIGIDYAPNALGQPRAVGAYLRNVRWHPNGALAGYDMANGVSHSMQQNLRGLPAVWSDSGLTRDVYSYDQNANVVQIRDELRGTTARSMAYDGLDRLTVANGPWGLGQYSYDALDNLRSSRLGSRSLSHNIDPTTNRLTSITGSLNLAMSYDANGNLAQRGSQAYVFDIANRLSTVVGKASYLYDGDGRRVWVSNADGSVASSSYSPDGKLRLAGHSTYGSTWFVYLGDRVVAEYNDKSGFSYVHTDALGSPVARTSPSGSLLSRTLYEPYGATASGSLPPGNTLGFTGHLNDAQTGLVYMQQRYYDPVAGRFLSVDPVTTDAGSGGNFNRYVYGMNSPYRYTDPDGRLSWDEFKDGVSSWLEASKAGFQSASARETATKVLQSLGPEVAAVSAIRGVVKAEATVAAKIEVLGGEAAAKATVGGLRSAGKKDAHHVIQDAAVRNLPGYNTNAAPGIQLAGPSNVAGTPHNIATGVQRQSGGGTYAAERRIGYKAMRRAGVSEGDARAAIGHADDHFRGIGVGPDTMTRIPGNR